MVKRNPREDYDDQADDQPGLEELWERADKVKAQKLTWLLPGRILSGSIAILEGQKGVGKSSVAVALAASLTSGTPFLGRRKKDTGDVLWLAGEESFRAVVKPRLLAAGADLSRIHRLKDAPGGGPGRLFLPMGLNHLRDAIEAWNVRLIVADPWICCLDPSLSPSNEQQVRLALDPLNGLMIDTGCVSLLSRHWTKDSSADRVDRGIGSVAVAAVARSIMAIDWPDERTTRRVLRVVRCNEATSTPAIEYHLEGEPGCPVMARLRELSAAEDDPRGDQSDPGERDVRADAQVLLRHLIGTEWVQASAVLREATSAAIGERTLRAAKAELGVRSRRKGGTHPAVWEWGPPKAGWGQGG